MLRAPSLAPSNFLSDAGTTKRRAFGRVVAAALASATIAAATINAACA